RIYSTCGLRFCLSSAATSDIYTLSLHDALPIFVLLEDTHQKIFGSSITMFLHHIHLLPNPHNQLFVISQYFLDVTQSIMFIIFRDRKSTRLNSSHVKISYAVFCLKKKNRDS